MYFRYKFRVPFLIVFRIKEAGNLNTIFKYLIKEYIENTISLKTLFQEGYTKALEVVGIQ